MAATRGRKLTELTSAELSSELSKAGLELSGTNVDDTERLLVLSTHLLDMGEDPVKYEFKTRPPDTESDTPDKKARSERQKLLERVIKFERNYFKQR